MTRSFLFSLRFPFSPEPRPLRTMRASCVCLLLCCCRVSGHSQSQHGGKQAEAMTRSGRLRHAPLLSLLLTSLRHHPLIYVLWPVTTPTACKQDVSFIPAVSLFLAARSHAHRLAETCGASGHLRLTFSDAVLQDARVNLKRQCFMHGLDIDSVRVPFLRHVHAFSSSAGQDAFAFSCPCSHYGGIVRQPVYFVACFCVHARMRHGGSLHECRCAPPRKCTRR